MFLDVSLCFSQKPMLVGKRRFCESRVNFASASVCHFQLQEVAATASWYTLNLLDFILAQMNILKTIKTIKTNCQTSPWNSKLSQSWRPHARAQSKHSQPQKSNLLCGTGLHLIRAYVNIVRSRGVCTPPGFMITYDHVWSCDIMYIHDHSYTVYCCDK